MSTDSPGEDPSRPSIVPVEPGEIVLRHEPYDPSSATAKAEPLSYNNPRREPRGYLLDEITWPRALVGILVILFLLQVFEPLYVLKYAPRPQQARLTAARTDLTNFGTALSAFKSDTGRYPTSSEGLQVLVQALPGIAGWNGPYVKSVPTDPWGMPYVYQFPGKHNSAAFDLFSYGPDKKASSDDVKNWSGP